MEDQEELLLKLLKEKVVTKETAKAGILVDLMCKEENALQTFKRKPPCSDKADSVIDLPIGAPIPQPTKASSTEKRKGGGKKTTPRNPVKSKGGNSEL